MFQLILSAATEISPLVFNLREIPAIPILAALPSGEYMWFLLPTLMVTIYGWINLSLITKLKVDSKSKRQLILRFFTISIVGVMIISFITSGSLISSNMSPVGVNPLRIGAVVTAHLLVVLLLMKLLPMVFKKKVRQG